IDEARTPLIISGAGTKSAGTYKDFAKAVRGLTPDVDFEMDEAKHTIATTEIGLEKVERALNIDDIYNDETGQLVNHLQQALKAEYMFHRDQQYVVIDGEVKIVDEFTGRIMEGRRYSEGLHQAIEAKENVQVREENQTLATITLQNYFLMYDKLSGMTGTAMTEDAEFREVYHVPVQVIPPNRPVKREDLDDLVYRTIDAKFEAVVRDVEERHQNGQPVLVGTVSIDNSERISRILSKRGIKHNVLNAKFHEREAQIIAQAGREGAVTIATNMAGRGTDILLGGNPDVMAEDILRNQGIEPAEATQEQKETARKEAKEICATEREAVTAAGGLCVIGTERHESRRIDNQLRGRSGRQGDPGQTQFYLSLEDDLMRRFGGDRMDGVAAMMQRYELPDDMPIKAKIVTKLVEGAQRKVEEVNFAMRKNVLDYDDVMNKQRQVIYAERNKILDGKDLMELIETVTASTTQRICEEFCYGDADEWDLEGLEKWLTELTGKTDLPEFTEDTKFEQLEEDVTAFVQKTFDEKTQKLGEEVMRELAAQVMLRVIDTRWMAYLQEMDYLKTGIGLRGFGQRDPLVEYKTEAY
ncbi:MAG: preprotein translocase subunit SecA, partial [Atopobium sp.]|nr:preprotein translocase subunit SecA [Atopobium sp.]